MLQVALSLMKNFEEVILRKTNFQDLMQFFSQLDLSEHPPFMLTRIIQDAFQVPNLELHLAAFETEYHVMQELYATFGPDWKSLSNVKKNEALLEQNEELIKHVGLLHGAIIKLDRITAHLINQLENQKAKLDRFVL